MAVSGGADSLCLAYLLAGWGKPLALIVDHGLRPAAAAEAEEAARTLAAIGLPSRILTLRGLEPGAAVAHRARDARYAALTDAAREAGCVDLLLGHHRRDQAETVLMRRRSGSGDAGLAGMAAINELNDVRLVRPFLATPPGRLRATLRAAGFGWVEDPSNRDPRSLRARLRMALQDTASTGPDEVALAEDAARHGAGRIAAGALIADALAHRVTIRPEGFAVLSPGPVPAPALAALIRTIGGNRYPAGSAALARLAQDPAPAVLHGVRLLPAGRLGPGLLVVREPAAMAEPVAAKPGAVWDNRFMLDRAARLPHGVALGGLGDAAAKVRRNARLPAAVLRALPALWRHGVLAAVPHIGYVHQDMPECTAAVSFAPPYPLGGAVFGQMRGGCEAAEPAPC